MNKSLFHIQQEYLQLAAVLEDNGGELTPEIEHQLTITQDQLQTKGVNYALVIRQLSGEAEIIKAEIDRLSKLKKSKDNAIDRLKSQILGAMQMFGIQSIKGELINISVRNNPVSVQIDDEALIAPEFIKEKVERSVDKTAIKEAIQSGKDVQGACLKQTQSLSIK